MFAEQVAYLGYLITRNYFGCNNDIQDANFIALWWLGGIGSSLLPL